MSKSYCNQKGEAVYGSLTFDGIRCMVCTIPLENSRIMGGYSFLTKDDISELSYMSPRGQRVCFCFECGHDLLREVGYGKK